MKFKFLLILLFTSSTYFCQDLNELNLKYGINKFKLESSYKSQQNNLEFLFGDEIKYYRYISGNIDNILDNSVKEIVLGYYKNKLYFIGFEFDNSSHLKDVVYRNLKNLFGKETSFDTDYTFGRSRMKWGYQWKTSKVILSYDEDFNNNINVWVQSNILGNEIQKSKF